MTKMNSLVYPFKTIRITQGYNDGNHVPYHSNANYKNYPLDEAGLNGGRDYFICPCDHMRVVKLYGNQNIGYHVWLESTEEVDFADGTRDFCSIFAVHLNQDDYYNLHIGQVFKRNQKIFREGVSGNATGNHIHFAVGAGRTTLTKTYWIQNNKGKWVLLTDNGEKLPQNAFFITDEHKRLDKKQIKFTPLSVEITSTANARTGAGILYKAIKKVYPGELYVVEKDTYLGWIKLKGVGWVSKKYVKINTTGKPTITPKPKITGTISTGSSSDEKKIWNFLMSKINNAYGVAGLMGNLYAESSLRSNNLQNSYETKLKYTDSSYTKAVDNNTYLNFVNDAAGYGLAQWTYKTRKRNLLIFAQSRNKSIGDLNTQLEFLFKELSEDYKKVLNGIKNAKSVKEASNIILKQWEKPKDQSESVQNKRASFGEKYYKKYAPKINTKDTTIEVGDIVKIIGTKYYSGATIPSWVREQNWIVCSAPAKSDKIIIDKSATSDSSIMSPIKRSDLSIVKKHK